MTFYALLRRHEQAFKIPDTRKLYEEIYQRFYFTKDISVSFQNYLLNRAYKKNTQCQFPFSEVFHIRFEYKDSNSFPICLIHCFSKNSIFRTTFETDDKKKLSNFLLRNKKEWFNYKTMDGLGNQFRHRPVSAILKERIGVIGTVFLLAGRTSCLLPPIR